MPEIEMKKKEWVTPELQIVVKSQPEENVLVQCKSVHGAPTLIIQSVTGQNCKNKSVNTCAACSAEGGAAT